jgi:hypothetical protein
MAKWGEDEHFDLKDLCNHFSSFSRDIENSINELSQSYQLYRSKLKEIKVKGDALYAIERKHKDLCDKLKKAKANSKPYDILERDEKLVQLEAQTNYSNYEGSKRALLREAFELQMKGWKVFAAKIDCIAHFGLHMANQIPQGTLAPGDALPPYLGINFTQIRVRNNKKYKDRLRRNAERYL